MSQPIVLQLQAEALQPNADLSNLLHKAFVVATKLNLRKFKKWVRLELDGYSGVKIPDHRKVGGQPHAMHPQFGPMPYAIHDPLMHKLASTVTVGESIAELQHMLSRNDSFIAYQYPPQFREYLMSCMRPVRVQPLVMIDRSQLQGILERVKTELIDWSLKLEGDGIVGEGLRFNEVEKKKAADDEDELTPQFVINIIGSMTESQLQQFSPSAKQERAGSPLD